MSPWRKRIGTIIGLTELSSEGEVKWRVTAEGNQQKHSTASERDRDGSPMICPCVIFFGCVFYF